MPISRGFSCVKTGLKKNRKSHHAIDCKDNEYVATLHVESLSVVNQQTDGIGSRSRSERTRCSSPAFEPSDTGVLRCFGFRDLRHTSRIAARSLAASISRADKDDPDNLAYQAPSKQEIHHIHSPVTAALAARQHNIAPFQLSVEFASRRKDIAQIHHIGHFHLQHPDTFSLTGAAAANDDTPMTNPPQDTAATPDGSAPEPASPNTGEKMAATGQADVHQASGYTWQREDDAPGFKWKSKRALEEGARAWESVLLKESKIGRKSVHVLLRLCKGEVWVYGYVLGRWGCSAVLL